MSLLTVLACSSIFLNEMVPFFGGGRLAIPCSDIDPRDANESDLLANRLRVFSWPMKFTFLPDAVTTGLFERRLML